MSRKIGYLSPSLKNPSRLARIRDAAGSAGFELVDLSASRDAAAECEIIFGWADAELISAAKRLRWLHTQSAGVDQYLRPEFNLPRDVILTNSSGAYGVGISEHLLTVTLMLLRRMGEYGRLQYESRWQDLGGVRALCQCLVTVVGLGDIGGSYARRVHALGARVRGVVRSARAEKPQYAEELFTVDKIDEALGGADIVALCLPGTDETKGLFSGARLRRLKRGALILNIGRGSAIDQDALIELLQCGRLGGAGLDVTTPEPLPADSKLWGMPNVILTPHVSGGASLELTQDLIADKFVRYLGDYIAGRAFERTVDRDAGY